MTFQTPLLAAARTVSEDLPFKYAPKSVLHSFRPVSGKLYNGELVFGFNMKRRGLSYLYHLHLSNYITNTCSQERWITGQTYFTFSLWGLIIVPSSLSMNRTLICSQVVTTLQGPHVHPLQPFHLYLWSEPSQPLLRFYPETCLFLTFKN